jgi:hypothetical protein
MNALITAQMKKDLVPLRGLLLGMGGLLALSLLVRILEATGGLHVSGGLAAGLQALLVIILLIRLIHLDSPADPDAFWRTRPLTGGQLLTAKAAFFLPPFLALLALSQPAPAAEVFQKFCPVLAGTAAFACVTKKFSETVFLAVKMIILAALMNMLLVVVVGGAWALGTLLILGLRPWPQLLSGPDPMPIGAFHEPFSLVLNGLVVAAYVGVVIYQYLTLRTKTAVRALFVIVFLSAIASSVTGRAD